MNFGPHIDPREMLVHCKLTQVHTPRGSFRGHSNHVKAYWCAVKRRFTTMVGTTYEPCGLVDYNKLEVHGRARREAARRRNTEWTVNLPIRNSSPNNATCQMNRKTVL